MHAAFDADTPLLRVLRCEILAWAKAVAIHAVAEPESNAVGFAFQALHLFFAERVDEVIEVSVGEP